RGQDVLDQVGTVDRSPDLPGCCDGLLVVQRGVVVEVACRVGERGGAHGQKPRDVPLLDVLDAGVDVNREVEQVRHHQRRSRLQHVESFENEDVGAAYHVHI